MLSNSECSRQASVPLMSEVASPDEVAAKLSEQSRAFAQHYLLGTEMGAAIIGRADRVRQGWIIAEQLRQHPIAEVEMPSDVLVAA